MPIESRLKARNLFKNKNAIAWILLSLAMAVHVFDEAISGFLPFYNNMVFNLKERLAFSPLPTFEYRFWLGGLITLIIILLSLTVFVYRGGKTIRIFTAIFGVLMIFNALGHILGSIYLAQLVPGFWSSPILLAASIYVVYRGLKYCM